MTAKRMTNAQFLKPALDRIFRTPHISFIIRKLNNFLVKTGTFLSALFSYQPAGNRNFIVRISELTISYFIFPILKFISNFLFPLATKGHPLVIGGHPFITKGNPLIIGGHPLATKGHPLVSGGHPFITKGTPLVIGGHPLMTNGHPFASRGHPLSIGGHPFATKGLTFFTINN